MLSAWKVSTKRGADQVNRLGIHRSRKLNVAEMRRREGGEISGGTQIFSFDYFSMGSVMRLLSIFHFVPKVPGENLVAVSLLVLTSFRETMHDMEVK